MGNWYRPPDAAALDWVGAQAGGAWRVVGHHRLRGGIAMAVDAVDLLAPDGGSRRLVLRRWLRPGWELEDPACTPAQEAAILARLSATSVPIPTVVAVDPTGEDVGVPALLMTHIDGRRPSLAEEIRPSRIAAMAEALTVIHALDGDLRDAALPFRPYTDHARLRTPAHAPTPRLWHQAIALTKDAPSTPRPGFLHRDYHPGNTLWQGRHLAGIVDWTGASWGPAAVDLAHWRANLGTRHGIAVADRVLTGYAAAGGSPPVDQPWWDVRILLDFLDEPDELTAAELGPYEAYLGALLARV